MFDADSIRQVETKPIAPSANPTLQALFNDFVSSEIQILPWPSCSGFPYTVSTGHMALATIL